MYGSKYCTIYSLHNVGVEFPVHRPVGVVGVYADDCEEFIQKIDQINKTVRVLDENGDDMIIRYTNFDYLRENYRMGLEE